MHHPTDRIIHTTAFVTPVVEHWLEREIAQWFHPMKALTTELHIAPNGYKKGNVLFNDILNTFGYSFDHYRLKAYYRGLQVFNYLNIDY